MREEKKILLSKSLVYQMGQKVCKKNRNNYPTLAAKNRFNLNHPLIVTYVHLIYSYRICVSMACRIRHDSCM